MALWTGSVAGSTVDQWVAWTLGTAVLHQGVAHEDYRSEAIAGDSQGGRAR
jgi:hypothetical protein